MSTIWNTFITNLPTITRYVIILGVIVSISFLFPDQLTFKYEFEKGQTWRYDDLVAPFDFAIKKTDAELAAETAQIKADFSPYYEMDLEVVKQQKQLFKEAFIKQLNIVKNEDQFLDVKTNTNRYLTYGNRLLERIYERGIIQLAPAQQEKGKDFVINVLRGNVTQEQTLEYMLTLESAKALLTDSLPYSRLAEPDFLYDPLEKAIKTNVSYSQALTEKFQADALSAISKTRGLVKAGDLIIARGSVVTDEIYQQLVSLKEQFEKDLTTRSSQWMVFGGYLLLTALIVGIFIWYLWLNFPSHYRKYRDLLFLLMWLVIYGYVIYAVEHTNVLSAYLVPFCIVPILIKTFYNTQLAFFTHVTIVMIASFLSSLGYEFTVLQILAGIVVLLEEIDTKNWSRFFSSMVYIFLTYALAFLGLSLIQSGDINEVDWSVFTWIFINVFLTMLAYPLIPLLERIFGFTSPITLMELSDMNRPLLRELAIKAPGTLQHSLQVANLAEAAARKIGADPLLVKVGALYHDIGKSLNPTFFIENQGSKNPHEGKTPVESAALIIEHVQEGVQMAKKHRLPNVIIDFIRTHHGTTRVEYFYRLYTNENPDKALDTSLFQYPGPKPRSKEESIVMMADTIEAACKSLKNPSEEQINEMIDKLVSNKINQGQMEDAKISFRELELCKKEFKKVMKSVHHARIEYPEEKADTEKKV